AWRALRSGGVWSQRGAVITRAIPSAVLTVLQMMSPVLGSRPGIHCWANSTEKDRAAPMSTVQRGRTPARVRQAPRGMKRSRFCRSSAKAESPELRSKDQPGGRVLPDAYSVATRMQAVEAATPAHGRRRFMGREDNV